MSSGRRPAQAAGLGPADPADRPRPAQRGAAERSRARGTRSERAAEPRPAQRSAAERSRARGTRSERAAEPRPAQRGAAERSRNAAFTLIELLAVLLIMGLVAGITLPNLSLGADRAVLREAEALASGVGFARQRAAATGSAHRVVIDVDEAAWWIEAELEGADAWADPASATPAPGGRRVVRMAAPPVFALGFAPLPGPFGRPRLLREPVLVDGVETLAAGSVRSGRIDVVFAPDGTADPAWVRLADEDGNAYTLRVSRLSDEVGIARE